jgi:resuscitation-promoting factor RpfB
VKAGTKLTIAVGIAAYLAVHTPVAHTVATLLSTQAVPVNASANVKLGASLAGGPPYYWTGSQFTCLDTLWAGESGWRTNADTRVSGLDPAGATVYAYGIPQSRPAQKMATVGSDWQTNPATQIRWGLKYIAGTYGSPCSALAAKRASGNRGY